MVTSEQLRQVALSFPEATEAPHFDKVAFRVKGKIFATLNPADQTVVLKLSLLDQNVFSSADAKMIYPVPGKWG